MDISIVIPAFNESEKIGIDICAAAEFIDLNNLSGEIVVVDDGSADNTAEVSKAITIPPHIPLRVISYPKNQGKGFAVREGIIATRGDLVAFIDSGLCIPLDYILDGMKIIKTGIADIAHGSRKLAASIIIKPHSPRRKFISWLFRSIFIWWLKVPHELTDTQCGFKVYKGAVARKLYSKCLTRGFLFDIEIILRALKSGYSVKEFPVKWTADPDSRLYPAKNMARTFKELISLKILIPRL